MFREIRRLRERPLTVLALERLMPVMRPLVDRECACGRERLAAAWVVAYAWFCEGRGEVSDVRKELKDTGRTGRA